MTTTSINNQEGWSNLSGGPYVESVTSGTGLGTTQAWKLSSAYGTHENGALIAFAAPTLAAGAGESHTFAGGTPAYNEFKESFSFRTVATASDPGLSISTSIGTEASVRNTYAGIYEDGGSLFVDAYATDASGAFSINPVSAALVWGDWYQLKVDAVFVNGPNNDQVSYQLLDANGNTVWQANVGSWESYYANDPSAEQAPGPVASNRVGFDLAGNSTDQGIYIDNFAESVQVAPEPSTWALMMGGLILLGLVRRSRTALR